MIKNRTDLIDYLREHIVGGIHVGHIHTGDRLPSIRTMARQLQKNPRTVKAAYRVLEDEGIVHVRGRSGVFVAPQEVLSGDVTEETARWMGAVVSEAWKRRIPLLSLSNEVRRFTQSRRIRCALVEMVEDGIVALGYELTNDWGFDVQIVSPDSLDDAVDADLFVATAFYAPLIHKQVERLGKPLLVLTIHARLQEAIRRGIASGRLIVVAADPRFGDRIRASYAADEPDRIRLILARDRDQIARIDPAEPILLTRAARQILGTSPAPTIYPHSPTLSLETARALANIVVRMNVAGKRS